MSREVALGGRKAQLLKDVGQWWGEARQPTQAAAILEDQHQDAQGGELLKEGPARDAQAGPLQQQLDEGNDQQSHHGAEHQGQDALLFVEVDRSHHQRPFEGGLALLRPVSPFGEGEQLIGIERPLGRPQHVAAIQPRRLG